MTLHVTLFCLEPNQTKVSMQMCRMCKQMKQLAVVYVLCYPRVRETSCKALHILIKTLKCIKTRCY
jgi:hypothetical protein